MFNVAILCEYSAWHIGTVRSHLEAFKLYSKHNIYIFDSRTAAAMDLDLSMFDVLVLHYSIVISMEQYISKSFAEKISKFSGYKVLFIQDEYRWVDRTVSAIQDLKIQVMYSVVNEDVLEKIYSQPSMSQVRKKITLTGFVPEPLTRINVPAFSVRPIDVGYRARRVPSWLGSFAQEKWLIGQRFKSEAANYGLVCDIESEENKRLYGAKWIKFLCNCRAVLGTESGASFVDFSGDVQQRVEAFELSNPFVPFGTIRDRFLGSSDGDIVIRVISPRCFEAAALRTLMIMYPGNYSGVLTKWRHYIPLERDHSNMDQVVAALRDVKYAETIVANAYSEIALNKSFTFANMVREFDLDLDCNAVSSLSVIGATCENGKVAASGLGRVEWLGNLRYFFGRNNVRLVLNWTYFGIHWVVRVVVPPPLRPACRRWLQALGRKVRQFFNF